jgi:hypothetical protein
MSESIRHLFFECVVAKEFLKIDIGLDYMSVAAKWLQRLISFLLQC